MGNWFEENVTKPVKETIRKVEDDPLAAAAIINPALLLANPDVVVGAAAAKESYDAGQDALDAADRAAQAEQESTDEAVRVMTEENKRTEATARARAAASGLSGASSEVYINALTETGRSDIDWLKKVGASNVQARLDEGTSAFHQARSQMWGNIGSMIPSAGQAIKFFL